MQRIYLDNNSTTPLDLAVLQTVVAELSAPPANPSSSHFFGLQAKEKLMQARAACASFFSVRSEEILFTASGTEAIHGMLKSVKKGGHLISTEIEHAAIHETLLSMEKEGFSISRLPVTTLGSVDPDALQAAIRPDTAAVILSLANSETGVKLDFEKIAEITLARNVPLLLDGVGFIGKERYRNHPAVKALALSAHKFHGPKGAGLLMHRSSFPLSPLLMGGGQEYQLRSGTENLAAILGLAKALETIQEGQEAITQNILELRLYFEEELKRAIPDLEINGTAERICNTSNLFFPSVDAETFLIQLDLAGVAASHGSACASGAIEPSRVLLNMGMSRKRARSSIRFSFARTNTKPEIDQALEIITKSAQRLS